MYERFWLTWSSCWKNSTHSPRKCKGGSWSHLKNGITAKPTCRCQADVLHLKYEQCGFWDLREIPLREDSTNGTCFTITLKLSSVVISYSLSQKYTNKHHKNHNTTTDSVHLSRVDYHVHMTSPHVIQHNPNLSKHIYAKPCAYISPGSPGHLILAIMSWTQPHA